MTLVTTKMAIVRFKICNLQLYSIYKIDPRAPAAVVARLIEQTLLTPDIRGSNPAIGKLYLLFSVIKSCNEKIKIKKKMPVTDF